MASFDNKTPRRHAGWRNSIWFDAVIESHWFSRPNRTPRYESPSSPPSVPATSASGAAEICIYSSHALGHVTLFGHVIDERVARAIKRFVVVGCRRNRSNRYRVAFCRHWCDCRGLTAINLPTTAGSTSPGPAWPRRSRYSPDAEPDRWLFVVGERCFIAHSEGRRLATDKSMPLFKRRTINVIMDLHLHWQSQ